MEGDSVTITTTIDQTETDRIEHALLQMTDQQKNIADAINTLTLFVILCFGIGAFLLAVFR